MVKKQATRGLSRVMPSSLLILMLAVAFQPATCRLTPTFKGRALSTTSDDGDKAAKTLAAVSKTAEDVASVLASSDAQKAVKALSGISKAAGFLGPIVEMGFALAGLSRDMESKMQQEFDKLNKKLDELAGKIDDLQKELKIAISKAFSFDAYSRLSESARAVNKKFMYLVKKPTDKALRMEVGEVCSKENMEKVLDEFWRIMSCSEQMTNCLSRAMKEEAQFEQAKYFSMAQQVVRDAHLALQMSDVCARIPPPGSNEPISKTVQDERRQKTTETFDNIVKRVQADYELLETEFWDTAINNKVKQPMRDSGKDKSNEDLAKIIIDGLQTYNFMWWSVVVADRTQGFDNLITNADTDVNEVKKYPIGGYLALRFNEGNAGEKSVIVLYRHKKYSSTQDPNELLKEQVDACHKSNSMGSQEAAFECFKNRVDSQGRRIMDSWVMVKYGHGSRSRTPTSSYSGMAALSGSSEGANTGDGDMLLVANLATSTQDLWTVPDSQIPFPSISSPELPGPITPIDPTPAPGACEWAGHCLGDPCTSSNDCDGELTCDAGTCSGGGGSTPDLEIPKNSPPISGGCEWAGHCLGDPCTSANDCDGELTCNSGKCGGGGGSNPDPQSSSPPVSGGCEWAGHCLGDPCSSSDDCDGELTCNSGKCGGGGGGGSTHSPGGACEWAGHCQGDPCTSSDDCDGLLTCSGGKCAA